MANNLQIKLIGGTSLLVSEDNYKKLVKILSQSHYWDENIKSWVGDMALESVIEAAGVKNEVE